MGERESCDRNDRQDSGKSGGISLLEIVASFAGLVLTIGILAFIGREAVLGGDQTPPAIVVEELGVSPAGEGWVVEFRARNISPATAQNVEVEGRLSQNGQVLATSKAVLDFVPGQSNRRGGLFFPVDPSGHQLELRALGYTKP